MSAFILDGRAIAETLRKSIAIQAETFLKSEGVRPTLAVILVGNDPASEIYVNNKRRACESVGILSLVHKLSSNTSKESLLKLIHALNEDAKVHGILLQLPLPAHLDASEIIKEINPLKDVDGLHPHNLGALVAGTPQLIPCTPLGCAHLIKSCLPSVRGKTCVIIGRSILVGKPLALLLTSMDATVTLAHSKTTHLAEVCRKADILVSAVGKPALVTQEFIKPGAVVIDVGINRVTQVDGTTRLVGDVDFIPAQKIAGFITPVPGGVGPMTIACLLENTLKAAKQGLGFRHQ